jgi:hypothetical protein
MKKHELQLIEMHRDEVNSLNELAEDLGFSKVAKIRFVSSELKKVFGKELLDDINQLRKQQKEDRLLNLKNLCCQKSAELSTEYICLPITTPVPIA